MKVFIAAILISLSAAARQTDNQTEVKVDSAEIKITTKQGFHLNAEAPATATFDNQEALFKPQTKTEKLIAFKREEKHKAATLKFYVCDDKKTVCEQHEQKINLKSGEVKATERKATYNAINDVKLASTNGKPTLLVFSAPWCPACVRMVTETYQKPAVEKQLSKLNFVKLNSDVADNYELAQKFNVKAIPTLILLDKDGLETHRWLDYQPAAPFAKSVERELKKVDQAAKILYDAQLGDPEAASQLGHKAFNSLDYVEAIKWFSMTKSEAGQKFKLAAEIFLGQQKVQADEKATEEYLQALQKGAVLTTSKLDKIRWTLDYLDTKNDLKSFSEEGKAKAKALVTEIDALVKSPPQAVQAFKESTHGEYGGFEIMELLWMKAKLQGLLETPDQQKTNAATVAEVRKKRLSAYRPGEMLLAIGYLKEANEKTLTEKLYKSLISKYPHSYVYFEKYARFLQKNKNLEQALSLANEALKYPEGNVPQLKLLKSQILKDLNQKEEAAREVSSALAIDDIQHKRYEKTYKKLNDLKKELANLK